MAIVHLSVMIDADAEQTFAVLADWRFNRVWERELVEYEPVPGDRRRFRWARIVGGRRTEGVLHVSTLEPPQQIILEGPAGDLTFRSEITLTSEGTHTKLDARVQLVPKGMARLFDRMIRRQLERQATGNLQVLKALVEATSQRAGIVDGPGIEPTVRAA
jgi:Polyketide cyclase / dehydrase and lipid transport